MPNLILQYQMWEEKKSDKNALCLSRESQMTLSLVTAELQQCRQAQEVSELCFSFSATSSSSGAAPPRRQAAVEASSAALQTSHLSAAGCVAGWSSF